MFRYRKSYKNRLRKIPSHGCQLCLLEGTKVIKDLGNVLVVENLFPYDVWEHRDVSDHVLVLPKQHVKGFGSLSVQTKSEIMDIISDYESRGYDIYARSVASDLRSVADHQHTHLIKTKGKPAKVSIYIDKPYIVKKYGTQK